MIIGNKAYNDKSLIGHKSIKNSYLYGFLKGQEYIVALKISNCAIVSFERELTGLRVSSKTYAYMMQVDLPYR